MPHSYSPHDTIAAVASAPGPGRRGIVRISGGDCLGIVDSIFDAIPAREVSRRSACRYDGTLQLQPSSGPACVAVPAALYLWPNEQSYTREPMAELHLLSSPPLLGLALSNIVRLGARPAEPGEFTLRAFLSGRIDLMQAEAVLGVIDACGPAALTRALSQLAGGISRGIAELREQLLSHLADLEAGLDFVEEDIEFVAREELNRRLGEADRVLSGLLTQAVDRMQSSGRRTVVLAGLPNAGKSTLFNGLVGEPTALVSSMAGTTRDFLCAPVRLGEIDAQLLDTAGWAAAVGGIEAAVDAQRNEQIGQADLILWCTPADLDPALAPVNERCRSACADRGIELLEIRTKSDAGNRPPASDDPLSVSAITGEGLDLLKDAIAGKLEGLSESGSELIGSTAARCRSSLERALIAVREAKRAADAQAGDELIACELRDVLDQLGLIVGAVYTDDILDRIFSRFCIGK